MDKVTARLAAMKGSAKDWRLGVSLAATIGFVALLHYSAPMTYVWVHPLLQRAYYIPILLAALWFGWRGGLAAAFLAGTSYIPHIISAWKHEPEYTAAQHCSPVRCSHRVTAR